MEHAFAEVCTAALCIPSNPFIERKVFQPSSFVTQARVSCLGDNLNMESGICTGNGTDSPSNNCPQSCAQARSGVSVSSD